jgi:hypothetical protein
MNDSTKIIQEIKELMAIVRSDLSSSEIKKVSISKQIALIEAIKNLSSNDTEKLQQCLYGIKNEYDSLINETRLQIDDITTSISKINSIKKYLDL